MFCSCYSRQAADNSLPAVVAVLQIIYTNKHDNDDDDDGDDYDNDYDHDKDRHVCSSIVRGRQLSASVDSTGKRSSCATR